MLCAQEDSPQSRVGGEEVSQGNGGIQEGELEGFSVPGGTQSHSLRGRRSFPEGTAECRHGTKQLAEL